MKIKVTPRKSGPDQTIECEKFDFCNGFLRISKPAMEPEASELYIACSELIFISNYGPALDLSKDKSKQTKK